MIPQVFGEGNLLKILISYKNNTYYFYFLFEDYIIEMLSLISYTPLISTAQGK